MTDREFLEHRRRLARAWPLTSVALLALLAALVAWLLSRSPNLIHPGHVVDRITAGTLEHATMQLAAVMLPVVVIALLSVVLVGVVFVYAMFAVERRYLRIIGGTRGPDGAEVAGERVTYHPIGVVRSPFAEASGAPIQPSRSSGARGTVELRPDLADGLRDLEGFSHVILLCHLDRARPHRLRVVPYLDSEPRGVFATRAPSRPNPIGLSVVGLVGIDGATLKIEGVDLLDGTPVLDVKPYVDDFDRPAEVRTGWLETARRREVLADDRFERPRD